jgi:NAD-dependent deacetylase
MPWWLSYFTRPRYRKSARLWRQQRQSRLSSFVRVRFMTPPKGKDAELSQVRHAGGHFVPTADPSWRAPGADEMPTPTEAVLDELAVTLAAAARVTVMTGSGVSAASGIPTFRGAHGLWKTYRAEQLATPEAFDANPTLVWEWYDWRRRLIAAAAPNRAHDVLAAWQGRFPGFRLITQNVDGLHERAGTTDPIRLHGSIWEVGCRDRCRPGPRWWRDERVPMTPLPPPCPHCGGLLRPGVVWYGEPLDTGALVAAAEASTTCEVFLAIGTSALVYPAAGFVLAARDAGARTVEINPDATPHTTALDLSLRMRAEEALDALERRLA